MKRTFRLTAALVISACSIAAFCQKNPADSVHTNRPVAILDCGIPLVNNACNQVFNSNLTPTYASCFTVNPVFPFEWCFTDWNTSHGTPQMNIRLPLIGPGINHASMWAYYYPFPGNPPEFRGEGIITRVPNLVPGHKYALSFYRRTWLQTPEPSPWLDQVNILLMKCNDYTPSNNVIVPDPPANSQFVYCETNVNRPNWERIAQTFTANDNYDIIRIYPRQANGVAIQWWLEFGRPELVDVTNFTAGPQPVPVYPNNCTVTIGPAVPNCGVTGAVYTWYGPNGQVIAAPASQQIPVDAANPANAGQWTLKMTVPGTVATNNTCSNALDVQASVNVPLCQACTPPAVTPAGPLTICSFWEATSNPAVLSTNISSNIQWYKDGVLIAGATSQTYTAYADGGQGNIVKKQNYTVKNTATGCESNSVLVNFVPDPYAFPSSACRNTPISIFATDYGPGTTYQWVIPGAIITPNAGSRQIQISFPASYTNNSYTTNLYITNPYGCNTPYINTQVFADYCRTAITQTLSTDIYPNPAVSDVTFTANDTKIEKIVITGFMNSTVKQVQLPLQKSITISLADLPPGIYNCRITTQKGVENQKLIIKR